MEEITIVEFSHPQTFHVFGRDENGVRTHRIDKSFHPYFYVDASIDIPSHVQPWLEDISEGPDSAYGDKTKKLTFKFMDDRKTFKMCREAFQKTYEDDIIFNVRYLIDHPDLKFTKNYRIITLDIETSMTFPIKDTRNTIQAITFHDNYLDKYVTYCVSPNNECKKIVKSDNWNIYFVLNEMMLLQKLIQYFQEFEPDICTGWNTGSFDLPYLFFRMQSHGLDVNQLSPMKETYLKSTINDQYAMNNNKIYGEVRVKGIQMLDSMEALKKTTGGALHSYSLNNVAHHYLKEQKIEHKETLDELYKNDVMKYCEYNKKDVELVIKLNKTPGILQYFMAMQDYSPIHLTDNFFVSRPIDNLILRTYHNKVVFPSKRKNIKEKYRGAYVRDPIVCNIPNVAVFDVRALYTNLQISLNISLDTKSPDGDIDIHGVKFKSSPEGLIPRILKNLQTERNRLKALMKTYPEDSVEYKQFNDKQNSVKVLLNSFYGVMGSPYFRAYDREIAESITLSGQDTNAEIGTIIEAEGHKLLYGDTDSNFVQINLKEGEDIIEVAEKLKDLVNKEIAFRIQKRTKIPCSIGIEFEKCFSQFLMIGRKKKYAGMLMYKDGKRFEKPRFFEMGFAGRTRDSTAITKKIERECLICLLHGGGEDDIIKIARTGYKDIKEVSIKDLAIKYKMSKPIDEYKNINSQHVRSVRNAQKYYEIYIEPGDVISFVFCKTFDGKLINDVIAINENTPFDKMTIDLEKTSERNIVKKLSHIFEAFGWNTTELDYAQNTLKKYFE